MTSACLTKDIEAPKDSSRGQLLEAKDNLQKMLANVPLTDDERAAVDDGQAALDQLLAQLTDVPTPAGPTPRQLGIPVIWEGTPFACQPEADPQVMSIAPWRDADVSIG
ncbi:hypothetical protein GCM10023084_78010 [Streptomyces lacrimifluminis]|uniref:Uncharacterized protein n=1 Tax=Streptomyces lacrimifluminis TaxID=1500077 RepID=A0A917UMF7_9ACTN|nr:hypothetical protein GCM10012282_76360 [Streptomyces lacrimifluminis]